MSLWLQAALDVLSAGDYTRFREKILPHAPIPIPACMIREAEFAERRCRDVSTDPLLPIRFLWLLEANEQRMFELEPLGRSVYHPKKLLAFWEDICADEQLRREHEAAGFQFDFIEKAVKLEAGWVLIGDRFVEDFLEVEAALRVELLFPDPSSGAGRPAFQDFKRRRKAPL